MSNTRRVREMNAGKLTRPRAQWHARPRGPRSEDAPQAQFVQRQLGRIAAALAGSAALRLPSRGGDR